jgi:hypothetical protein
MPLKPDDDGLVKVDRIDRDHAIIDGKRYEIDSSVPWQVKDELTKIEGVEIRVRLTTFDEVTKYTEPLRKAYWFGPSFDFAKLDDSQHSFRTVHGDTENCTENILYGVSRKAFFDWQYPQKEPIAVFQIELFQIGKGCHYESMYLHSIRDRKKKVFTHLDGAKKQYSNNQSYESSFQNGLIKSNSYQKSFRIDGSIPNDSWKRLIGAFFNENPLIAEYFGKI